MSILLDPLPEKVKIRGTDYPINWDFRTSIRFELLVQDDEVSDEQKIREALKLYYPIKPQNPAEAVDKIIWFYGCGKEKEPEQKRNASESTETSHKQVYSFDYDAEYIYAAFLSQYGIDLTKIEKLHWWKFRAMFKALDEKCEFVKIMGYRSMKITSKMSKEQRAFYKKMQALHALPASQKEREETNRLVEALLNGGDLTGLV